MVIKHSLSKRLTWISLKFSGLILLVLILYSFLSKLDGADCGSCRGIYMSPAYARVKGFDETHTRLALKYSLYLYREQNIDIMPDDDEDKPLILSGTPVLFVPGNAGSYKQIRSIASESASSFYRDYIVQGKLSSLNKNANNLDFFSADFNEDFTAFHGRTMLDQAEYLNEAIKFILDLYKDNETPAKSVIIIGHSMGGVVSRVMLTLPNYLDDSVNTIITLAAPHAAAPATFDGDLLNVFASTDEFWRNGYIQPPKTPLQLLANKRLQNVSLISITGGLLDNMLPADYTSLIGLIPASNGFSISTTGIPGVWTPIDHLAIVWCDQLRKKLAEVLLLIVDKTSTSQTYSLENRMEVFRKTLLSGFEKDSKQDSDSFKAGAGLIPFTHKLKIDTKQLKDTPKEHTFALPKINNKRDSYAPDMHLFYIPKDGLKFQFSYLSSIKPESIEKLGENSPSIMLCKTLSSDNPIQDDEYKKIIDYTDEKTKHFVELKCVDVNKDIHTIPRSFKSSKSTSESSIGADSSPFYFLQLDSSILSKYDAVILAESSLKLENNQNDEGDFVLADIEIEQNAKLVGGESSLWTLFTRGYDLTLPAHRPIVITVDVPSAWSSLLAYKFDVRYEHSDTERFSPILAQSINDETKWHINLKENNYITSTIQGVSPFCPFYKKYSNLKLFLFSDSLATDKVVDIYMSIDWFKSLKLLVMKYRLSIVSLPIFIISVVIFLQFKHFIKTDHFPSFYDCLLEVYDIKTLIPLCTTVSLLSIVTANKSFQMLLNFLDPVENGNLDLMQYIENENVHINLYFLGLEEKALWFFGPIAMIISLSLVSAVYDILVFTGKLLGYVYFRCFPTSKQGIFNRRRAIGTALLIGSIPLYLPFQFAYIVCIVVQAIVVIRNFAYMIKASRAQELSEKGQDPANIFSKATSNSSSKTATASSIPVPSTKSETSYPVSISSAINNSKSSSQVYENFINFNVTLFMLMFWILPINIPVLVVWIHNFSLKWATPFSSHHNFLAVIPIVLLIQNNVSGNFISRPNSKLTIFITKFIIAYLSIYSLIYGARHLFWLHHLLNLFAAWILILLINDYLYPNSSSLHNESKDSSSLKLH